MSKAKFRVYGMLDGPRPQEGTVTIDRVTGIISVRPLHRRRTFDLPLSTVADLIVSKICKAEAAEKRRRKKRRAKRGKLA